MTEVRKPLFETGKIYATPGALEAFQEAGQDFIQFVKRHITGDWGELDEHDKQENELAVKVGNLRVFSAYHLSTGVKIWLITEADRSVSTFLLPSEY